jgi:large subunit ribosomal protein L30
MDSYREAGESIKPNDIWAFSSSREDALFENCRGSAKGRTVEKKLKITLVKSSIGRPEKQRKVLRGMGLVRMNRSVTLKDTPEIRGMVGKVSHLVAVEEISG